MSRNLKTKNASQRGFTLVELVTVIIMIGILGALAAPKMMDSSSFQDRGAADQVKAALRYGQKVAIAQRSNVTVTITAPSASSNCNTVVKLVGAVPTVDCQISNSVALSFALPLVETFDSQGRPSAPQAITVGPVGDTTTITIEQETGYVH